MSTFSPAEDLKLSKGLPGPAPNPLGSPPGRRRACRQSADGGFRFAAHEAVRFVGGRPTASSFLARPRKEPKKGARGLGGLPGHRCAPRLRRAPQSGDAHSKRATGPLWIPRRESPCDPARRAGILRGCLWRMPGARYARRPLAGAPPRGPGLSPLRGPGLAGRILYKDGLRPNPLRPRAASGWPAAKAGGARFTDQRTSRQHPARRRAAGAMPLPASLRNRPGSASGGGTAFAGEPPEPSRKCSRGRHGLCR